MRTVINIPAAAGARFVESALEGLAALATEEHAAQQLPPLYRSGVRYQREQGSENWLTPTQVLGAGIADCEDLAAYRVGELRASGVDPQARIVIERTGPRTLHAIVMRGDGTIEDPSRQLGMKGRGEGVTLPRMVAGVEEGQSWAELARRKDRGHLFAGPTLAEALSEPEVGFLPFAMPVLDTLARAAGGALQAVVPGMAPSSPPRATMPAARQVSAQLTQEGTPISPGEVLSLATQLARVVRAESQKQTRDERRRRGPW